MKLEQLQILQMRQKDQDTLIVQSLILPTVTKPLLL